MHFFAALATVLFASTASTYAKCYNSGIRGRGKTWLRGSEGGYTVKHANDNGCVKFKLQNISAFDRTIYETEASRRSIMGVHAEGTPVTTTGALCAFFSALHTYPP
ncbi:hypothetical protein DFH06DRAFT_1129842 [Mycena polygramma]|nr:hypothetical protein DFH06DRAFT_1129842 [Mycena polygramma]